MADLYFHKEALVEAKHPHRSSCSLMKGRNAQIPSVGGASARGARVGCGGSNGPTAAAVAAIPPMRGLSQEDIS